MDIILEPQEGSPFSIEIGYFDTVLEIKEKIEKYRGIPISRQTLIFNDEVLKDELDVHHGYEILDRSHIQLIVKREPQDMIELNILTPPSEMRLSIQVNVNDTIRCLKEIIQPMQGVSIDRLVLKTNNIELEDDRLISDYDLVQNSDVEARIKPSLKPPRPGPESKKMTVLVLPWLAEMRVAVEVKVSDKVGVLRKELEELQPKLKFHLPPEGYFFIHKQSVMDEERSFLFHAVEQGDLIEVFRGTLGDHHDAA